MLVSVLIVNFNGEHFIHHCIDSLLRQEFSTSLNDNIEIIVIDNNSSDNSLEVLAAYQSKIQVIKNPHNIGFGRAHNIAAKHAKGDYLLLLNPDAHFTSNTAIEILCNKAHSAPETGIWGCRISKQQQDTAFIKKSYPKQQYAFKKFTALPGTVPWIIGACMLIKKDVFNKLEGFDSTFFLYGEETDLCLRCRQAGWQININDDVSIEHIGSASEQADNDYPKYYKRQQGLLNFCSKHYSYLGFQLLYWQELISSSMNSFIYRTIIHKPKKLQRYQAVRDCTWSFQKQTSQ